MPQTNTAAAAKQPLDEVMLAMDVVDTLRHRSKVVSRELNSEEQDNKLISRLRSIYANQGIDVPDHILADGVKALREERFVYKPTPPSLQRKLAEIYVDRDKWGKPLLIAIAILAACWMAYYAFVTVPRERAAQQAEIALNETLPAAFRQFAERIPQLSKDDTATNRALALINNGEAAVKARDFAAAQSKYNELNQLATALEQTYQLRIVTRPDERSGVWRTTGNSRIKNYYIIVESLDSSGNPVAIAVTNEETGKKSVTGKFGIRVSEREFEKVKADKLDDGIIQNNIIGYKIRGNLEPEYTIPTLGGIITEW